LKNRMTVIQLE